MARGKKTGGRNFKKGAPGRPKGSKDKVPRTFKASIRAVYQELATEKPELFRTAIERGLRASAPKSFQYVQLGAHYLDGKPIETVKLLDQSKLSEDTIRRILQETAE